MSRRDHAAFTVPTALTMLTAACSAAAPGSDTSNITSSVAEVMDESIAVGAPLRALQVWPQIAAPADDARLSGTTIVPGGVGVDGVASPLSEAAPIGSIPGPSSGDEGRLLERVGMAERFFDAAVRNPADLTLLAEFETATVAESPARLEFVNAYWTLVAAGRWAVPDPAVANSVTVLPDGRPVFADDGLAAWVLVCAVSGDSLMGMNEVGEPAVLADVRNAREVWQEYRLVDGEWLLYQRMQVEIYPEATSCDDLSVSSSVPAS